MPATMPLVMELGSGHAISWAGTLLSIPELYNFSYSCGTTWCVQHFPLSKLQNYWSMILHSQYHSLCSDAFYFVESLLKPRSLFTLWFWCLHPCPPPFLQVWAKMATTKRTASSREVFYLTAGLQILKKSGTWRQFEASDTEFKRICNEANFQHDSFMHV